MHRIRAMKDALSCGKHLFEHRVATMEDRRVAELLIGIEFTRLMYIRDGVLGSSSLMDTVDGGLVNRLENKNTPPLLLVRWHRT